MRKVAGDKKSGFYQVMKTRKVAGVTVCCRCTKPYPRRYPAATSKAVLSAICKLVSLAMFKSLTQPHLGLESLATSESVYMPHPGLYPSHI